MKRANRFWITSICAFACLVAIYRSHTRPIYAQQSGPQGEVYDGIYVSASVDVDSNYNLYTDSYMEVEVDLDEDIDEIEVDGTVDQDGSDIAGGVSYGDDDDPAEVSLKSTSPVALGHEYGLESDGYACYDEGDGDCDYEYSGSAYTSVNVSTPPPQIASLSTSSVYQGDQGTLTLTGSNFVEHSGDQLTINFSGGGNPFTLTGTPSSSTASFSYNFSGISAGTYTLSVTNNEGTSNSENFTVLSSQVLNACAVTSNPHAGYTSIASTGTPGGSGSMAVSFSGAAFAAVSQSVPYGPYSTPSSIAAHMAALITQHYFRYGLTAKAFGPNIVYSGDSTLGAVSNTASGSSFTTTTSPTAASGAEVACGSAPSDSNSYTLTPAKLNLSTGDTNKSITISASLGNSMSGIAYSSSLTSNNASSCQASLSFANPQSSSTGATAASPGCSGVFSVSAAVNGTSTNQITVVVPPQIMIQTLVGEAGGQAGVGDASMSSLLLVAKNRFGDKNFPGGAASTWQAVLIPAQFYGAANKTANGVEPELDDAAAVFAGTTSVSVPSGCEGYWSPTSTQFMNLQKLASQQAGSIPDSEWPSTSIGAPSFSAWKSKPKQAVIKSSIANNKRAAYSSAPALVLFQLAPSASAPAVITIP